MGGRDTAGRHVFNETDNETWPHALFSLRLSGRQAARSRAVPLTVPCTRLRRLSYTPQLFHHSQNSQSIYIYDREIGAKISVSVSISRFLRLENILYLTLTLALTLSRCCRTRCAPSWSATATASRPMAKPALTTPQMTRLRSPSRRTSTTPHPPRHAHGALSRSSVAGGAIVALCALTHGPSFQPSAHEGVSDGVLYVNTVIINSSLTSVALGIYKAPRLAAAGAPHMSITKV